MCATYTVRYFQKGGRGEHFCAPSECSISTCEIKKKWGKKKKKKKKGGGREEMKYKKHVASPGTSQAAGTFSQTNCATEILAIFIIFSKLVEGKKKSIRIKREKMNGEQHS
ncbi:hypothetical protein POVWA1_037000 [Plasmodium ovale wallikeri]|uniref:Uncharacterized protein n=1 Tax=Plasmodium ovale wallikeri TaxID=864142 RepID=A0A1A8Z252_PLAOA|nr:hypothetical protein POVWA1_037000 [Plasmodium ovale wallikeri]